jgi:23S rRNA G2445 N2-methylase RlmL
VCLANAITKDSANAGLPCISGPSVGCADFCSWNATALPLRRSTVDVVVCDMPFGMRCGNPKKNNNMYPRVCDIVLECMRGAMLTSNISLDFTCMA